MHAEKNDVSVSHHSKETYRSKYSPSYEELNQLLYNAKRQLNGMTAKTRALKKELDMLQKELISHTSIPSSISYQLGALLITAAKSPKALANLPVALWRLRVESKARRMKKSKTGSKA